MGQSNSSRQCPIPTISSRGLFNFSVHSAEPKGGELTNAHLRFLGDDLAVFPNVNRRAVHTRGFAGDFGGAAKSATDGGGELFAVAVRGFAFHSDHESAGARSAPYEHL